MQSLSRALFLTLAATGLHAASADFARDIQPIFQKRCIMCHGAQMQMAGLRLDNRDLAMKGSLSGPVIKPHSGDGRREESDAAQRTAVDARSNRRSEIVDRRGRGLAGFRSHHCSGFGYQALVVAARGAPAAPRGERPGMARK